MGLNKDIVNSRKQENKDMKQIADEKKLKLKLNENLQKGNAYLGNDQEMILAENNQGIQ